MVDLPDDVVSQLKYGTCKYTAAAAKAGGTSSYHYHVYVCPELGVGRVAMRRIPCACFEGFDQLKTPIKDRYTDSSSCKYWPIFGGLNDWHIIQVKETKENVLEESEDAKVMIYDAITDRMSDQIEDGNIGAFVTEDATADGYCLVKWIGEPYNLEEEYTLVDYDPPIQIPIGELVVDAIFFEKVGRAPNWYTPVDNLTVVQVQHVMASDIKMV